MFVKSAFAVVLTAVVSCGAYFTLRSKTKRRADRKRFNQTVDQSWRNAKRYARQLFPQGSPKKEERASA